MKKARRLIPKVEEVEMDITQFTGLNTFGPHADLKKSEQRFLDNYDNYGGYIKSRRGSQKFISDVMVNENVLTHAVFDAGDDEYVVVQQTSGVLDSQFRFIKLAAGSVWEPVIHKTSALDYILIGSQDKADMFVSNGKIYIYHTSGNSIFEFNTDTIKFERRKMGLPAPQIAAVTPLAGSLDGKRIYGAELVYKDTSVTPNVPLIVSGPNRALESLNPLQNEGALAWTKVVGSAAHTIKISPTLNDGSAITDAENDNWTHIRLWRSRDVTTATNASPDFNNESEITGRFDELYQVQEIDKVTFLATLSGGFYFFSIDNILDDDIPFPLDIVTDSRLELYPIPSASTGAFVNNRVWASGITKFPGPGGDITIPNIESKIFYSAEADTIYSENCSAIHIIDSEPGDGQKMIKLLQFREDLIGIKEGKTGRVRNADPNLGWTTEDETVGILNKEFAQFVPNVGICAIVNDQNDFRIFGFDLQWKSTFGGQQISRPIRDEIKTFTPDDIDFFYINGKLIINGGKGIMLVLATEQQSGWSRYKYPFNNLSETAFIFANGTRAAVVSQGQPVMEIEAEDSNGDFIDTDYDVVAGLDKVMSLELDTWKFQDREGRSLVEERFLSIVAKASTQFLATAFVNGKLWKPAFPLLLDPVDYPDISLQETEYQGYQEFRAIGNYINYVITTSAPCTIYSIMLHTLVQRNNIRPGFDPFELLEFATVNPPWVDDSGDIDEDGVSAVDIDEDGVSVDDISEG